jgi:transposase
MNAILRRFYGPHAERFDPTQLLLFGLKVAEQMPVDEKVVEAESGEKLKTRRINHHKHGRGKLPEHLPRVEVPHDLTDEQKKCPCCGEQRVCIGSEISEQLEFDPSSLKVLKHIRHKYACKSCGEGCDQCDCKSHIELASKPAQPIEKGLPGPGLITSKLGDHLPLYRLERIFGRHGVDIARSTMCAWMLSASELVGPLVELITTRVKQSRVIHTDETRVPVQKSKPILAKIKTWLDTESQLVLPRSPMAQAINYTLNQWEALSRYTEQGYLNIDNNAAERALKRVALGRKNWLFAGHDEAGASHARLYTLIASAERHGVDPQAAHSSRPQLPGEG